MSEIEAGGKPLAVREIEEGKIGVGAIWMSTTSVTVPLETLNNYQLAAGFGLYRFTISEATSIEVTGIKAGHEGQVIVWRNVSTVAGVFSFRHEDGRSEAKNQLTLVTEEASSLPKGEEFWFQYDAASERWVQTPQGSIAKESVGEPQLKVEAVSAPKIKRDVVPTGSVAGEGYSGTIGGMRVFPFKLKGNGAKVEWEFEHGLNTTQIGCSVQEGGVVAGGGTPSKILTFAAIFCEVKINGTNKLKVIFEAGHAPANNQVYFFLAWG